MSSLHNGRWAVDYSNGFPVVTIPKGFQVSKQFITDETIHQPVKTLLSDGDANTKLAKSNKYSADYRTYGLSLAPSTQSGFNTCLFATVDCKDACLDNTGLRAVYRAIHYGKIAKTVLFFQHREWFLNKLHRELSNKVKNGERKGHAVACRLNVLSDIAWEQFGIIDEFPTVQFYDYTKDRRRIGAVRPNYWTTFSRSGRNERSTLSALRKGNNVAIVFADSRGPKYTELPQTYKGFEVINGDQTDLRFTDKRGVVVGLKLKSASHAEYFQALETPFPVLVN